MIDESTVLDLNKKSQKKLGIMINVDKNSTDIFDCNDILEEEFGTCFEIFTHIQHEEKDPEFIAFISAGLHIPTEEIQEIYEKYQRRVAQVEVSKDEFFEKNFDFKDGDMFDLGQKKERMSKKDFFADIEKESKPNKKVKQDVTSSY